MNTSGWTWDESLYAGSAEHYAVGRMPYPAALIETLVTSLGLDGTQHLLDIGCGPGSVVIPLASHVRVALAVDADAEMLKQAEASAERMNIENVHFVCSLAEDLPVDHDEFDVIIAAQSFHWMDQRRVAGDARKRLRSDGAFVHIGATTHRGEASSDNLGLPQPPHERIEKLVAYYLGPVRRAGRSLLPDGTKSGEGEVLLAAGFSGPEIHDVDGGDIVQRSVDEVASAVYSLSSSAPHLFGSRLDDFDRELRSLLLDSSQDGLFAEKRAGSRISIWRNGIR